MTEQATYSDMFNGAIDLGMDLFAYLIFNELSKGVDPSKPFDRSIINTDNINAAIYTGSTNPLGLKAIKLYSSKQGNGFHLCLADSEESALGCISKYSEGLVFKVMHVPHGLLQPIYDKQSGEEILICEFKDRCIEFPAYVQFYVPETKG